MKAELTFEYIQSIESEPLPKIFRDSERLAIAEWKQDYDEWTVGKMEQPIPAQVWAERLKANWARLAEYDRLTAERKATVMCEVIGTAIICGRPEKAFRVMVHCGWCDKKTRGLHEVVYGGYACNEYCGECGTVAYDHEYSGKVKSGAALERAEENILRVAAAWEQGGDQRDELEAYLSDLVDQSRKFFEEDSAHETKD